MNLVAPRFVDWLVTGLVVAIALTYVWYLAGLRRLPKGRRPRTATYNRFGQLISTSENPDYHVIPAQESENEDDGGGGRGGGADNGGASGGGNGGGDHPERAR